MLVIELRPMCACTNWCTYIPFFFFLNGMWYVHLILRPRAESGEWMTEFKASLVVGQPGLCSEALCSICFVYAYVQLVVWKWEEKYVISVDLVGSRNWNGIKFDSKNSQLSLPDTFIKPCSLIISCAPISPMQSSVWALTVEYVNFLTYGCPWDPSYN